MRDPSHLSRRERQIMDSLYRRGEATVAEIQQDLPKAPTDSAIRAMLRLLEGKRHVARVGTSRPQVYRPALEKDVAGLRAVRHLLTTFFGGSRERAIQAVMASADTRLDPSELKRLSQLISAARRAETEDA
ncbi:MAG: Penicillinase repressor [Gemmatimonadetes bacterium]|nr:Penicillinase repressor [Gemmatimonadota bacterium]